MINIGRIRIWSDNGEFMAEYKKYKEDLPLFQGEIKTKEGRKT